MTTIKSVCMALMMASGALASPDGFQPRTDINPALQYYQAFLVAPDLAQADKDFLFANPRWDQKLSDRAGELLHQYDNQFKLARQASRSTVLCDWGTGPAVLLPQLARNKIIAQAARLRARWFLQQGQPAEARDDLLAAFTLGRDSSRDGTLIAALVQFAAENIVYVTVAENFGRFDAETLKQLAEGFDAAPARGTVANCVPTEKAFFRDWMIARILELQKNNPHDNTKAMAGVREMIALTEGGEEGAKTAHPSLWEQVERASGGTVQGVLKILADESPLYERLEKVTSSSILEFPEQMKQFKGEFQKSGDPFVTQSFTAWEKCVPKEFATRIALAMVRAAIEYKVHGETGLNTITDPASAGPFEFQRFVFEGADRGFQLKSAYNGRGFPEVMIFVEQQQGQGFKVDGKNAGEAFAQTPNSK